MWGQIDYNFSSAGTSVGSWWFRRKRQTQIDQRNQCWFAVFATLTHKLSSDFHAAEVFSGTWNSQRYFFVPLFYPAATCACIHCRTEHSDQYSHYGKKNVHTVEPLLPIIACHHMGANLVRNGILSIFHQSTMGFRRMNMSWFEPLCSKENTYQPRYSPVCSTQISGCMTEEIYANANGLVAEPLILPFMQDTISVLL